MTYFLNYFFPEQEKLYNPEVTTESLVYFTDSNSAGDFGLPTNVANLSAIVDLVSDFVIISLYPL